MEKTAQLEMIVERRPSQSAREPAKSAPKKVSADSMETIRDFSMSGKGGRCRHLQQWMDLHRQFGCVRCAVPTHYQIIA